MNIMKLFNSKRISKDALYLQMKKDKELFSSRYRRAEKNLAIMQSRYDRVCKALNDAIATYSGNGCLVTQERIEAWKNAMLSERKG